MSMKSAWTAFVLTLAMTCLGMGEEPFFKGYNDPFAATATAEMKKDQILVFLKSRGLDPWIPLADGGKIDAAKITLLSPSGLKLMTDSGFEVVSWNLVDVQFRSQMGWTMELQLKYEGNKRHEASKANATAYRAKLAEMKKLNTGPVVPVVQNQRNALLATLPVDVSAVIRSEASRIWPDDYSMQAYTIKKQHASYDKLLVWIAAGDPRVPRVVFDGIVRKAISEWPKDFDMIIYSVEREIKSWHSLNR